MANLHFIYLKDEQGSKSAEHVGMTMICICFLMGSVNSLILLSFMIRVIYITLKPEVECCISCKVIIPIVCKKCKYKQTKQ